MLLDVATSEPRTGDESANHIAGGEDVHEPVGHPAVEVPAFQLILLDQEGVGSVLDAVDLDPGHMFVRQSPVAPEDAQGISLDEQRGRVRGEAQSGEHFRLLIRVGSDDGESSA